MTNAAALLCLFVSACTPSSTLTVTSDDCCACVEVDTQPAVHVIVLDGQCSERHDAMPPTEFVSTWMEGERRAATRVMCQSTCNVGSAPNVDARELALDATPKPVLDALNVPDR